MHTNHVPTFAALLAAATLLAGCNNQRAETAAAAAVSDEGIAKSCTVSDVDAAPGSNVQATMAVGNDGGWCAVRVAEKDGQPFATGLVRVRPEHGRIVIEKSGNRTLVQYYPATGYTGADTFTAALRSRTANAADVTVKVAVMVAR